MTTVLTDASLTADGTEQTLANPTGSKVYMLHVDLANMQSGDTVVLRAKLNVLSGGTARTVLESTISDAQVEPDILVRSIPIVAPQGVTFTLEQTAGTNRAYPYRVETLADVTVENSGTVTLDGTEQTLVTETDNKTFVLITDHNAQLAGDTVVLRLKTRARSGGTDRVSDKVTLTDAQTGADLIQQSVPTPSPYQIVATIEKTGGANHAVSWALVSVGS